MTAKHPLDGDTVRKALEWETDEKLWDYLSSGIDRDLNRQVQMVIRDLRKARAALSSPSGFAEGSEAAAGVIQNWPGILRHRRQMVDRIEALSPSPSGGDRGSIMRWLRQTIDSPEMETAVAFRSVAETILDAIARSDDLHGGGG